jgi:hypothetical protein
MVMSLATAKTDMRSEARLRIELLRAAKAGYSRQAETAIHNEHLAFEKKLVASQHQC